MINIVAVVVVGIVVAVAIEVVVVVVTAEEGRVVARDRTFDIP